MAYRLAPQARAELSNIWSYIVKEGGNVAAADGVIDTITERFYLLSQYPRLGRTRDDLRPGLRSFEHRRPDDNHPHRGCAYVPLGLTRFVGIALLGSSGHGCRG